jgi:hypothetical protein
MTCPLQVRIKSGVVGLDAQVEAAEVSKYLCGGCAVAGVVAVNCGGVLWRVACGSVVCPIVELEGKCEAVILKLKI